MRLNARELLRNSYPLALAVVPVLCWYSIKGAATMPLSVIVWPLVFSLIGGFLVLVFAGVFLRDAEKASVLAATLLLAAFAPLFVRLLVALLGLFGLELKLLVQEPVMLCASAAILAAGLLCLLRGWSAPAARIIRAVSVLALLLQLTVLALSTITAIDKQSKVTFVPELDSCKIPAGTVKPDFYYIILDAYANAETLRVRFHYDNQEFRRKMAALGFQIIDDSFSNYALTELSLSSSLNMDYLDQIRRVAGARSPDFGLPYHFLLQSRVLSFLKANGYKFVNVGSVFGPMAWNEYASENIPCGLFGDFGLDVWQCSLGGVLERLFNQRLTIDYYRRALLTQFGNLERAADIPGPKFVFAHLLVPHPPFVFKEDGSATDAKSVALWWPEGEEAAYLEQAQFTEKAIVSALEKVIEKAGRSAIVVVQSDHGPAFFQRPGEDKNVFRYHRMRIFNALKVPQNLTLPEQLSPVNTFRILFDNTFGCKLQDKENRAFLSTYESPFEFVELTPLYNKSGSDVQKSGSAQQPAPEQK